MYRSMIASALVVLASLGWTGMRTERTVHRLKEERMTVEYDATADEAALVVSAESEIGLGEVEVRDPSGGTILEMRGGSRNALDLFGFVAEKGESSRDDVFREYPEGRYRLRGRTVDGDPVEGTALFRHDLPRAPVVVYPFDGAVDVPTTGLSVSWVPDPLAIGYRASLEDGESDRMLVELGAGSGSFLVPDGVLAARTRYWIEIAAIAPSGNSTLVKVPFMTR